ncbi:MAG: Ig-like domain-containing protein [Lachnospiraceae bacterium]|nr:Ig-like domain-containing protein [Lachnospiraceae bacterium]MDD7177325.1 FlgD immunoglobulin-like domain containing protein [bacterium]MDY5517440.1 FlgD immunoglobulin-like domain containing protein [Lachnospiraceae bacterium]
MNHLKKKTWKYILALSFLVLLVSAVNIQPVQAAVKLNASSMNLCVGERTKLSLTGTSAKAKWKSSKPSVVKVSSTGTVAAKGVGTATVTAVVGNKNYNCKFNVNKTFKLNKTSVSIKKNTAVTAFLAVNGAVNASVADKKICSVTFGKWDGDYMPLTIVPKKVGSTTITFTNSVNKESCTMKVKVTALPVNASFQTPSVNTGADTFIIGENKMNFAFQLNRDADNTVFKIYDGSGQVARVFDIGALDAKKVTSILWDGLDDMGEPMNGVFKYAVVADGNKTSGGSGTVLSSSPFGRGDGTEENPFLVSGLAELCLVKNYNGAHFVQDADIDFNYTSIEPLFDDETPFTGTYDGKYENVSYRMVNLYGYKSVFGTIGAEGALRNVSLNTTGSLLADTNNGTIDSCTVSGNILSNSGNQAAMLVVNNNGQIRNCDVTGNLTVGAENAQSSTTLKAGGIAVKNTGMIAQCTSSVMIMQKLSIGAYVSNSAYEVYSGGIVAENASGAFITQCTFTGSIDAQVTLLDAVKDVAGVQGGKIYSGYVAGSNHGYINRCVNASSNKELQVQGTGIGMVSDCK